MAKTIWIYGIYGAGKSSLASDMKLFTLLKDAVLLDADAVRMTLNSDLAFSDEDISENLRRMAEVAKILNDQGINVVVAAVTPKHANRLLIKQIVDPYFVWVDTPLELTIARDHKGLYANGVIPLDHFAREFEEPTEDWERLPWKDLWAMLRVDPSRVYSFGRYDMRDKEKNETENDDGKEVKDEAV